MSPTAPTLLPLTVLVEDLESGATTEHVFKRSPIRVGRNALNELTLQAPFVSLSHAVVRFQGDHVEVIDLGSTNGVQVDGKRIETNVPVVVTAQSDVRIGSLRFHFSHSPTAVAPAARERTEFRRATEEIRLTPGPHGLRLPPELRTPAVRTVMAPVAPSFALESPETPASSTAKTPPPAASVAGAKVEVVNLAAPAAAPEAATAPVSARSLETVVDQVFPHYSEYRLAWRKVHEAILAASAGLPQPEQAQFFELLDARMPGLYQEEQFRALSGAPVGPVESARAVLEFQLPATTRPPSPQQRTLLQVFARTYAGGAELSSDAELERLLERISEVLECFGTAFLELRKGQAEFGEGIAVRTVTSETPLRRARSPQELLRHLLDPAADGAARIDDLTGGFGEVMIHQVAMLGATRQGIRALLDRLDPKKLQNPLVWPVRFWKRWRAFESVWAALAEEEHAVQVVFGPEFARSYAMVMGGHAGLPSSATAPRAGKPSVKTPKAGSSP